jgi:tetratricopeptide (TPR) repeat protein
VSVGLADVVRKCLASKPADRYSDAADLADDLRRHLHDLPLRGVRNRSPFERWRKWRRRHPGALAWGVAALSLVFATVAALAVSWTAYRQRVGQLAVALEDSRRSRAAGRYDEALHASRRGLDGAESLPGATELIRSLEQEALLAQRGRTADELHRLADLIRFRYGIDPPPLEDALALARQCQAVWERRNQLVARRGARESRSDEQVRTDLLELAAVWADLRVRAAPASEADRARGEALLTLGEAEDLIGPSLALDIRREEFAAPGAARAAGAPARAPRSAWESYDLGRYHLSRGRIELALVEFHRALAERPQDFWSNFYQGLCAFRLGQAEEAAAAFRTCVALAPRSAPCRYNRALAYEALGRADDAAQDYSRALYLDPGLVAARLNRGILSHRGGRHGEAVADFERALGDRPDRETRGRLHYNLALARLAQGDRASARSEAEAADRLDCPDARRLVRELSGRP